MGVGFLTSSVSTIGPEKAADQKYKAELEELQATVQKHKEVISRQELTPADVKRMNSEREHLEQELDTWYENTGGKPIWVTEFACNPWAERACDASLHARLMDQVVPVLEASPLVFRYAWFAAVWKSNFGRPTPSTLISIQVRRVRGNVYAGQRPQPRDLESVDVVQLPEQLVDRELRRRLVADPDERRVRRSSRGGPFVRDAPRPQHRLGRVLLRDGRLRRARRYELHDDVPLRRGQSRPRAARQALREFYVGESVSAFTSADAVADSFAHCRGALVVVVVVVRQAGDSGNCLDGDPRCWHLCMCWSDVILLWTNVPRVMGFERSLRISLLNLVVADFHALRLRRRAHSLVEL